MKKASFFIVLGLAILLLFGCVGGGGLGGGVSEKPKGIWHIALYRDDNNDGECEFLRGVFYVNVKVNDAKDGYDVTVEDKNGNLVSGVDVPTFTYNDKVVKLEIKSGTEGAAVSDSVHNYYLKLDGKFYEDVMIGKYTNSWNPSDKGIWYGDRKGTLLGAVSIDDPEILAERAKKIEDLVKEELGYTIKIDLSEFN